MIHCSAVLCVTIGRLTDERALSNWQLMLVQSRFLRWLARPLLPKGWAAGSFQTAGDVNAQRIALQTLGNRLAALSIFSFLCKCISSALLYFAQNQISRFEQSEAVIYLTTVLLVQAVPSWPRFCCCADITSAPASTATTPALSCRRY